MTADRMPPNKCDLVVLQPPGDSVAQTGLARSRFERIVDHWPAAALVVALVVNVAWLIWLLWLVAQLIFWGGTLGAAHGRAATATLYPPAPSCRSGTSV